MTPLNRETNEAAGICSMVAPSPRRKRGLAAGLMGATACVALLHFASEAQAQTVSSPETSTIPANAAKTPAKSRVTVPATSTSARAKVVSARVSNSSAANASSGAETIMVTGSLFRDPNTTSASPITHITMKDMQQRGIKTVTDALQLLSSNGAGNLTNAWSAGGGFAAGASAPSLRGLSTDSTLVLMDGQRLS